MNDALAIDADSPSLPAGASVGKVVLRPRKALPFYGRHPWVLASAVSHVEISPGKRVKDEAQFDGQVMDLFNEKDRFVARGFFNSKSRIRMRLLTWVESELIDEEFFRRRIGAAIRRREQLGYEAATDHLATATRLIFSESDFLSGLVVDRYGDYLVVQATSLAIAQRLTMIVGILFELLHPRGIVLRSDKGMGQLEGVEVADGNIWGELAEESLVIEENGLKFGLDLREGQKTGFYLDQRENRRAAASYLKDSRVLDMFCYTGGFSLAAAALGHAKETLGIDSSKRAIAQAQTNAQLNQLTNCQFEVGDGFKTLDALEDEGRRFDAVILDPPKFARSRSTVNQALMAYHRVNRSAVNLLERGGILVTCSCSGSVSREDFMLMLSGVAQKTGRDIQILETRGAAPDHPVSATCLETEYLKCVICRVL